MADEQYGDHEGGGELDADQEDPWFGEGSAFGSGEELAAALMSITMVDAPGAPLSSEGRGAAEATSVEAATTTTRPEADIDTPARPEPLVGKRPNYATGWSIRHSVHTLKMTETAIARLQSDAVEVAWNAAALVFAQTRGR